jgi:hypothetical protein
MRLYVPATLDELDAAAVTATAATWTVPSGPAHAVTPALASTLPDEDDEGLEWHAFLAAAHDSLVRVAGAAGGAVPLRVVVTVELPADAVLVAPDPDDAPGSQVRVTRNVRGTPVIAVHVDEPEAAADVVEVLRAIDDDAEPDLDAALQRVTDRDLLWYDPTELAQIPRPSGRQPR